MMRNYIVIIMFQMFFWGVGIVHAQKSVLIRERIVQEHIKIYQDKNLIPFDTIPQMHEDKFFFDAYDELSMMLNGTNKYDLKRAQFLVEWAYFSGRLDYSEFCDSINQATENLKKFIRRKKIQNYKTAPNAALFYYFTTPSPMNGNKAFTYDVVDCGGDKDISKLFVSKLIKTHTGQCYSLPVYYKILCNELGGESYLATGPSHMYIKHIAEDGRWVNVELTTGCFARDEWYIQSMGVSTEAIKNGVYLTAMSNEEDIAYMIYMLAEVYMRKYNDYDYFTLICADRILDIFPHNYSALNLIMATRQQWGYDFLKKYGKIYSAFFMENFRKYREAKKLLETIGYTQITREEYIERVEDGFKNLGKDLPNNWHEFRKSLEFKN